MMLRILILITVTIGAMAQPNCNVYTGGCKAACELYLKSESFNQGTYRAHELYDSAIMICPDFAFAHHEKSVGYLKNGEILLWRKHIDVAVKLQPTIFLGNRAWCRFKFLHDYDGAMTDLHELRRLNNGFLGWSNDGDYDLRVVLALCYREIGLMDKALALFEEYFTKHRENSSSLALGSYDYLHYGVSQFKSGNFDAALDIFLQQVTLYKQLPDTYYYLAWIYHKRGDYPRAMNCISLWRDYFTAGYYRKDPYCEALDEVYPTDIERLASLISKANK